MFSSASQAQDWWLKTGVEFYNNAPFISTVATPPGGYSDWSIYPTNATSVGQTTQYTIEARREGDELGTSLWVYLINTGADGIEERVPLREVNWVFASEEGVSIRVGAYAARPNAGATEVLEVSFKDLQVVTR